MRRGRRKLRALTAAGVGTATLTLGAGSAGADEFYDQNVSLDHTFTNGNGAQVTCTVSFSSSLARPTGRDAYFGTAYTSASGFEESCESTFVVVDVTYRSFGRDKRVSADSIDGDVFLQVDDVQANYVVQHSVFFNDCISNCEASFTTRPK
jgi:hypothetical protein